MDFNLEHKRQKEKDSVNLFDQMSKNLGDIYEGKGSFMEYAKSKEEEVQKMKDDLLSMMYGPGYKENIRSKKNGNYKKSPKSIQFSILF